MLILGIHDGHNATAALLKDGEIIAAISEERLTRRKNEPGYPVRAVKKVLEITGFIPADIDYVALASEFLHPKEFYIHKYTTATCYFSLARVVHCVSYPLQNDILS